MEAYFVYLARCKDGTLYCGICKNVKERTAQHNAGTGAKYTRGRRPIKIVYTEKCKSKSDALKRELEIKKLSREQKEDLI